MKTTAKKAASPAARKSVASASQKPVSAPAAAKRSKVAQAPARKASPSAKVAAKPVAKAKPAVKGKPATKAVSKSAKPTAKAVKAVVKTVAKSSAKSAAPATRKLATPVKSPVKKPAKTVVKTPVKAPPKDTAKSVAKAPVKVAKAAAKPVVKAPVSKAAPATVQVPAKALTPPKTGAATPPSKATPASVPSLQDLPQRSTRASARLAQITVPSMPQSVASTAAKASYLPSMSSPVLNAPPLVPAKKDAKLANNWKNKSVDQLTDAEVMAMPDGEYMNDLQMAYFRRKLQQLKNDILANAGETTEHLREETVVVPDPADRATIEEEHALELRTRDRERKLLKKIEQSIARIDAGDYGYCDETGEPIGVGRLLARPTATLSLEAQQRRELKQKMFGD